MIISQFALRVFYELYTFRFTPVCLSVGDAMKILCLGDSLTFGFGVPRQDAWIPLAQKRLAPVLLANAGIPGDTTGGMLARLPGELERHRPSFISVMGGLNDIFFGGDDASARANIAAICHQSVSRNVKPILCTPTPIAVESARKDWSAVVDFFAAQETCREYVAWLRSFASVFGIPLIDYWAGFERRMREGEDMFVDGLHPNPKGQEIMAGMFVEKIQELL